jgi:hypothetical protein
MELGFRDPRDEGIGFQGFFHFTIQGFRFRSSGCVLQVSSTVNHAASFIRYMPCDKQRGMKAESPSEVVCGTVYRAQGSRVRG